jgi:hypothetical protein
MPVVEYSASIEDGNFIRHAVNAYSNPADFTGEPAGFDAWIAALDGIISGIIVDGKITLRPTITGVATASRSGYTLSRLSNSVDLRFNLSGTSKKYTQNIPAVNSAAIAAGKAVPTFLATYTSLVAGGSFTDNTGTDTITSVYGLFLGSRKYRKQLQSKSFTKV